MIRYIVFCLLYFWTLQLSAQQRYSGLIVDAKTGEPIPYAHLYLSSGRGALSNLNGQYEIVADSNEQVRISFVGYTTQTFRASVLKPVIKMRQMVNQLSNVNILGTDAILMKIWDKLRKDYKKQRKAQSHYFCRMTFMKDQQIEMVEAFLTAKSAVNLRQLEVNSGQYWAKAPNGRIESRLRTTNLHNVYMLGPMIKDNDLWRGILTEPFPEAKDKQYIHDNYEISYTTLTGDNDKDIYAITLTPIKKRRFFSIMGGTLYVDAQTLELLRFEGTIKDLGAVVNYADMDEKTTLDVNVSINYQHKNGFTEVTDITASSINEDVQFHTVMTNVKDYQLSFTNGELIGRNLVTTIEKVGSNPELENRYTFIQRTDKEMALLTNDDATDDISQETAIEAGESLVHKLEQLTDTTGPLSYIKKAMLFSQVYPQEKVYLHLDNTGYFMGETIWMNAYVIRTDEESRTDQSKVLYVELLNPSGDVVEQRKLLIVNGEAYGDIKVDSLMTTGFYELRAFTRNMTNWGTSACFSRVIPIFQKPAHEGDYSNPTIDKLSYRHRLNNERQTSDDIANDNIVVIGSEENRSKEDKEKSKSLLLHFYPEGGALVEGLPSRVAFTANDREGQPVKVSGYLADINGNRLGSISTGTDGKGTFIVKKGGVARKVIAHSEEGKEFTFDLPVAESSGCTMTVDAMQSTVLTADISCSPSIEGKKLGYVMMHGGKIVRCDTLTAQSHHRLSFQRSHLPEGVSQLTLFDSQGRILAERLFFIIPKTNPADSISITSTNESLLPCGKVTFNIQSHPNATLSFSAVDAAGMVNGNYGNMRSWLLLGSEVRGYIHHPEYYLETDDERHRQAADLLMLTQGWRRYDWQLMSGQATFAKRQPCEDRLLLFGDVRTSKKALGVDSVEVTAYFYDKQGSWFNASTITTDVGQYAFALPNIQDEWPLQLIASKNGERENFIVGIDRHFSPPPRFLSDQETQMLPINERRTFQWNIPEEDTVKWENIEKNNHMLQNVTVKAKRRVWDRTSWNDETNARHFSRIFYDCDKESDRIADMGKPSPLFFDWLKEKNSFFSGSSQMTSTLVGVPLDLNHNIAEHGKRNRTNGRHSHVLVDIDDYMAAHDDDSEASTWRDDTPSGFLHLYGDGLTYKNRPIVWVVDNLFCTITDFHLRRDGNLSDSLKTTAMFAAVINNTNRSNVTVEPPQDLEDVKSVYISESTEGLHNYIFCDEIDHQNPVVVYCYTHRSFQKKEKGVRYTHFQGFNSPSTFQMEDYSKVPPMEDFRRTIYWNPNVKLDRHGKATVEFFNNSSCTEMFISAEGMTKEGRPLNAYE
jgi:hypothetical protein